MAGKGSLRLLLLLLCVAASLNLTTSLDRDVLLKFKDSMSANGVALGNWIEGSSPCIGNRANWTGVICDEGNVLGLQLENMSLSGTLNLDTLVDLPGLRTLSFMNNSFEGPMPNAGKLGGLRLIYFSWNKLSGEIPDNAFEGMVSLKKVHLSHNQFSGSIPTSLAGVSKLLELKLDDNKFTGSIPDLQQSGLMLVNVSYNNLEGRIPDGLSKMNASLFEGNKDLCGTPLKVSCNTNAIGLVRSGRFLSFIIYVIILGGVWYV